MTPSTLGGSLRQSPPGASADIGSVPSWKLVDPDLTGCDNMAMLASERNPGFKGYVVFLLNGSSR